MSGRLDRTIAANPRHLRPIHPSCFRVGRFRPVGTRSPGVGMRLLRSGVFGRGSRFGRAAGGALLVGALGFGGIGGTALVGSVISSEGSSDAEQLTGAATPADQAGAASQQSDPLPSDRSAAARELCERRLAEYEDFEAELLAAYATTAGDAAAEDERRRGSGAVSPLRSMSPGHFLAHCFFDAEAFGIAPGWSEPPPGAIQRLEEVITADDIPFVLAAGSRQKVTPAQIRGGDGS